MLSQLGNILDHLQNIYDRTFFLSPILFHGRIAHGKSNSEKIDNKNVTKRFLATLSTRRKKYYNENNQFRLGNRTSLFDLHFFFLLFFGWTNLFVMSN